MRVFYFLGIRSKFPDGERITSVRCSCLAKANVVVKVQGGEPVDARCPVCHKAYDVLVEMGEVWPTPPENIISAE